VTTSVSAKGGGGANHSCSAVLDESDAEKARRLSVGPYSATIAPIPTKPTPIHHSRPRDGLAAISRPGIHRRGVNTSQYIDRSTYRSDSSARAVSKTVRQVRFETVHNCSFFSVSASRGRHGTRPNPACKPEKHLFPYWLVRPYAGSSVLFNKTPPLQLPARNKVVCHVQAAAQQRRRRSLSSSHWS